MSYCWGHDPFLMLTADNYAHFRAGVDLSEFPQLFREAFVTCQKIGVSYIWIDCYCIIQSGVGSEQDWQSESASMRKIYTNAILNIGAADAASPHEALFYTRDSSVLGGCEVARRPKGSKPRSQYHVAIGSCEEKVKELYFSLSGRIPRRLFTRGWIFQERLLSARMLHYTREQIFWECSRDRRTVANEEFSEGIPVTIMETPHLFAPDDNLLSFFGQQRDLYDAWKAIVESYSRTRLSYPNKDKLVAIGGVAERMSQRIEDEYVAGMFKMTLLENLLWQPAWHLEELEGGRASEWRAPTWSWAALDNMVIIPGWMNHRTLAIAAVRNVDVQLANPNDPFGALLSASLELTCRPCCAHFSMRAHGSYDFWIEFKVGEEVFERSRWKPDVYSELDALKTRLYLVLTHLKVFKNGELSRTDLAALSEEALVGSAITGRYDLDDFSFRYGGLVVQRDDDGRYRRVGKLQEDGASVRLYKLWKDAQEEVITII